MSSLYSRAIRRSAVASVAVAALMPVLAMAQEKGSADEDSSKDIVVTGTLLRNVAPAGAQPITLTPQAIQATGAVSTDQLLATIPQLSSFGQLQTVNAGGTQLTVNRINIRNLPQGVGGGSPTLILLDGHRLVGAGVKQSYPDPDVIPPALIQRVDVVPDGGSATYGSDAIGGVINFVTRNSFDGIEAGIRQGFGADYSSTDVNFTAGKTWSTGSAFVGYNFSRHSAVYGNDRDYIQNINYTTGLRTGLSCTPGNVVIGGANPGTYAVVGGNSLTRSNANLCDSGDNKTLYPKETRHSVMAGFRQELSDSFEFEIKGYYSNRHTTSDSGPLGSSANLTTANPNYVSAGGVNAAAAQTVYFDFAAVGGREVIDTKLWSFGITPTFTWKLGHDWQVQAFYNYGQSKTTANDPILNNTALGAGITAGTINPYNIAASNSGALAQVLNYTNYGIGKDTMHNAKITFDGPLFKLPGGDARVAIGGEYLSEKYSGVVKSDTIQNVAIAPLSTGSRNVKSAFVELNLPLIGPDNGISFIHSLSIAAAERYDSYSDFGGNWAPSLGVTLKPVEWIGLRARWNKSFQAPAVVQLAQASAPTVGVNPAFIVPFVPLLVNPAVPFNNGPIVSVQGTVSRLEPQKARDYNLGFDISPPFIEGLNLHFTYFNIVYSGQIGTPPLGFGQFYGISTFTPLYIMTPTIAQLQTFLAASGASATDITNAVASVNAQGGNAYVVADVRARNLGISKVHGYDFSFDYSRPVSFGTIYANFSASLSKQAINAADGVNFGVNQAGLDGSDFNFVTRVGANVGDNFRGQLTWNHLDGYNLSVPAQLNQTKVGSFNTFDVFMQYDVKRENLPPITLSLGVNNVFDKAPPIYRAVSAGSGLGGFANGSTVGRVVQLGASVKF